MRGSHRQKNKKKKKQLLGRGEQKGGIKIGFLE